MIENENRRFEIEEFDLLETPLSSRSLPGTCFYVFLKYCKLQNIKLSESGTDSGVAFPRCHSITMSFVTSV